MNGPWMRVLLAGALLFVMLSIYFAGPEFFGLEVEAPIEDATPTR